MPTKYTVLVPTRNVVLTDRQAQLVQSLVDSGRYQNASEVLRTWQHGEGRLRVRVSAQIYNEMADVQHLISALAGIARP